MIDARSLQQVPTGGRIVLPCQCRAATQCNGGLLEAAQNSCSAQETRSVTPGRPLQGPRLPFHLDGFAQRPLLQPPMGGRSQAPLALARAESDTQSLVGVPLEATRNPPSTQQTQITTAGRPLQGIRLAFCPCRIAPTAQLQVPTETLSWRTCVQIKKAPHRVHAGQAGHYHQSPH